MSLQEGLCIGYSTDTGSTTRGREESCKGGNGRQTDTNISSDLLTYQLDDPSTSFNLARLSLRNQR